MRLDAATLPVLPMEPMRLKPRLCTKCTTKNLLPSQQDVAFRIKQRFRHMNKAFVMFDQDRSGRITSDELRLLLTHFNLASDETERVLASVDRGADGKLDYNEFTSLIYGGVGVNQNENVGAFNRGPQSRRLVRSWFEQTQNYEGR